MRNILPPINVKICITLCRTCVGYNAAALLNTFKQSCDVWMSLFDCKHLISTFILNLSDGMLKNCSFSIRFCNVVRHNWQWYSKSASFKFNNLEKINKLHSKKKLYHVILLKTIIELTLIRWTGDFL